MFTRELISELEALSLKLAQDELGAATVASRPYESPDRLRGRHWRSVATREGGGS